MRLDLKPRGRLTYRSARLYVIASNRLPVIHCVECGDFVDTHRRHLEHARNFIHDGNGRPAKLPLAQVKERHHGGFLVLRRIAREDFFDESEIRVIEFERNTGVVVRGVAVLKLPCQSHDNTTCFKRTLQGTF